MGDAPLGPGTVLAGRFRLEDLLDDTEGARFWRATDQILARSVAVHVLPDSDPRAASMLTAARTSALVTDAHLLRVLDAAEEDGVVYVVNEWGSGISLDRLLAEGLLSPRRAAWVVKEVAEAISTAHRNGVAHGRLLPENVLVTEAGSVKLIGFVVDAVLRGREHRRVTGGDPVSAHEGDVLNLAGLLYACLTGRWPGTEGSTLPAAPAERHRPLRPRRVRAGVPRPLDAICDRVLDAEAHEGHSMPIMTAHEIYAALSDYVGDPAGATGLVEPTAMLQRGELSEQAELNTLPGLADLAVASGAAPDPAAPDGAHEAAGGPATVLHPAPSHHEDRDDRDDPLDTGELEATGAMPVIPGHDGPDEAADDRSSAVDSEPTVAVRPGQEPGRQPDRRPDQRPDVGDPEATQAAMPAFLAAGSAWSRDDDERDHRDADDQAGTGPGARPMFADERPGWSEADGPRHGPSDRSGREQDTGDTGDARDTGDPGRSRNRDTGSFLGGFVGTGADDRPDPRSTGPGNGPVPSHWGPDPGPDEEDSGARRAAWGSPGVHEVPGKSWMRLAAAVAGVLVLVIGIVFAVNLGRGDDPADAGADSSPSTDGPSSAPPAPKRIPVSAVSDFDPQGDPPEENPDLAPLAVDRKPGTAWQTLTYRGNPELGGLKDGVGLLLDLGEPTEVGSVRVSLLGDGTSLDLLAAPEDVGDAPTGTDGLDRVASAQDAGARATLSPKQPVTTRWLVVWLTKVPAVPGGFQGKIAEVVVRS